MKSPHALRIVMLLSGLLAGQQVVVTAAETSWSIEQLVASKAEWDRLKDVPMRVEGRVSSVLKQQMRFLKCELPFRGADEIIRPIGTTRFLEVTGMIRKEREGNKLYFEVTRARTLPTDLERVQTRALDLKTADEKAWYDLGTWARDRGAFYDDAELTAEARLCFARGLGIESRSFGKEDVDARTRLAQKARDLQMPESLQQELHHAAFRAWWNRAAERRPVNEADLQALSKRLTERWGEALTPLAEWPEELSSRYKRDPINTYNNADADERRKLHRIFQVTIAALLISRQEQADGQNGDAIAALYEAQTPEYSALAAQSRERYWTFRQDHMDGAARKDVLALADDLRRYRLNERATGVLKQWLRFEETRRREAPALVELADDYRKLLKDDQRAANLLIAAHRLEPENDDAIRTLESLGYELQGGTWLKGVTKFQTPDEVPAAKPPTEIRIGMNAADVHQLLGTPSSAATLASLEGVEQIWTYGSGKSGSRLIVQFHRRPNEPQFKVVQFLSR